MLKNWINNIINLSINANDDVNVDIARENYQAYQKELECKQKDYIKTLCNEIKICSRKGWKSIKTEDLLNDFMTYEFMMEIKEYFEQRGFHVKEEGNRSGILTSWLRISWE